MERVSATLSADINNLVSAVNKSIGDYEAMVEQLNKLIPVLQEHIKHSEDSVSASEQNSEKLTEVLKTLDEIVKKNQQLRYELTQWRRVHKKVKINDKNGTKECPNCSAENPIDANFCRKCNYGFWDCEIQNLQVIAENVVHGFPSIPSPGKVICVILKTLL